MYSKHVFLPCFLRRKEVHLPFILRSSSVVPSFILRINIIKVKEDDAWSNVDGKTKWLIFIQL